MKVYSKRIFSVVLVLILTLMLALPVSAAKPQKSDLGLLMISTSGNDVQHHLAVCIAEEDGDFVYSGQHPIQQQEGLYASVTNKLEYNSVYEIEEDTEYEEIKGVYRYELKEKVQSGSSADVFLKTAAVKKNETVYFVHLDMEDNNVFVTERTAVRSVQKGVITTKDKLEDQYGNGDFSVIFNDNGNVVGFCKAGVATVLVNDNNPIGGFAIVALLIVSVIGLVLFLLLRKKKNVTPQWQPPVYNDPPVGNDDEVTIMDGGTIQVDFEQPRNNALILKCHGGCMNGYIYKISGEEITIGRLQDNTIKYPEKTPGISRHHAKLFWQNGQLMLVDLGSSNGTYYNNERRLSPMCPVVLKPGDVFCLGEKRNCFEICNQ